MTVADNWPQEDLALLVVIPCLNEENTVARVVRGVPREIDGVRNIDVIVIDDGSSDQTGQRAREAGAQVVVHQTNRGLGWSFGESVEIALHKGVDILVNIDGDGQFDPADISTLVGCIVRGDAQMATASRFVNPELLPVMPSIKKWGNRRVAEIIWLLTGRRYHDVSCGFRAFSLEALLRMNLFGTFTHTQETFMDFAFKGLTILEIPVKVRGTREFGDSRMTSNMFRYAIRSFQIMLRAFISYRPFSFFSAIASVSFGIGLGFLVFLMAHYFEAAAFSPHIWAGFVGGSFVFLSILILVVGFIGDILLRIRLNQEMMLYYLKRRAWTEARELQPLLRSGEPSTGS
ncbi:MAG: glycosyltransferase family 2 protein [Proteobacteria bacterium]|nr:glycosyltransferase family 2 protein [Pseudomonadota bacterium]